MVVIADNVKITISILSNILGASQSGTQGRSPIACKATVASTCSSNDGGSGSGYISSIHTVASHISHIEILGASTDQDP